MSTPRTELSIGPNPVDIEVYENDDSLIVFYPFGTTLADVPGDFADYDYAMDVWDGTTDGTLLLTSSGGSPSITTTRDNVNGKITFTIPRATMLALDWTAAKRYDVRETDPDAVNVTLFAGQFSRVLRGNA